MTRALKWTQRPRGYVWARAAGGKGNKVHVVAAQGDWEARDHDTALCGKATTTEDDFDDWSGSAAFTICGNCNVEALRS